MSIPRDLLVPIPSCPKEDGSGNYSAMSRQKINESLTYGGLRCTVMTVEKLTGLEIAYAAKIEFDGVIAMSTAVGGVDVCLAAPIKDQSDRSRPARPARTPSRAGRRSSSCAAGTASATAATSTASAASRCSCRRSSARSRAKRC